MSEKSVKIIASGLVAFAIVMILLWFFLGPILFQGMDTEAKLFQSISLVISSGLAGILFIYLGKKYRLSTATGKIWLFFGIGLLFWCAGEALFMYYDLFTEEAPFPSIADVFYLIAYFPLALGLILQTRLLELNLSGKEKLVIFGSFIVISILVIIFVLVLPIQGWYEGATIPEEDLLGIVISALYPAFDLVLLICVMVVFAKFRHGKINMAWAILLIGILMIVGGDIVFNWIANVIEEYQTWEFFDLLYLLGYVSIFAAGLSLLKITSKTFE